MLGIYLPFVDLTSPRAWTLSLIFILGDCLGFVDIDLGFLHLHYPLLPSPLFQFVEVFVVM